MAVLHPITAAGLVFEIGELLPGVSVMRQQRGVFLHYLHRAGYVRGLRRRHTKPQAEHELNGVRRGYGPAAVLRGGLYNPSAGVQSALLA